MENCIEYVFKSADRIEILKKFPGSKIAGMKYE